MDTQQFINEIADIIEADPELLTMDSDFREEADFWSSLVGFAIMTFLEDQLGVLLPVDDFIESHTIGDLYHKCASLQEE